MSNIIKELKYIEEQERFKGLDRTFSKFGKRVTFDYWTRDTVVRVPNGCCGVVRQIRRRKGNDVVVALFKVKIK